MKKLTALVITLLAALVPAPAAFAEAAPGPVDVFAASDPAAAPAQDDVSGGNEYSEEVPPTATGDPDDTSSDQTSGNTDDTTTSQPAPTGGGTTSGSDVAATEATETGAAEEGGLPRTGADSWLIALIGVALLGGGILVRRAALPQR
jgi:LPXTG-motif cell wall-anchored protein